MVERLDHVGYACNLVDLVIVFVIKNPYSSICTHTVRPIPRTTDIRMRMTSKFVSDNSGGVVFVTPVRHVKDMMQTMKRIMDKEWKRRIDEWIEEALET